ncbi:MAG TPA: tetratricopeptide repeat protein [Planctomycetota bacterium]|nr:tetratricopeptide repeat protein [Planctomycetota bacterium]
MDAKVERWRGLVAKDPGNPLHNFALAQALFGAGEHEQAERAFARCLELDPQWMVAAIRRGACLVALQRWDEARQALDLGAALAQAQQHDEPWQELNALRAQLPG